MRPAKLDAINKAYEFRDKVSERERYTIEADYYKSWETSYDKALEAYHKLLDLYPEDNIGNTNLGILYFELEEWNKAISLYERNLRNNPDDRLSAWNLVETYEAMGLCDKAQPVIEEYLQRNPGNTDFLSKRVNIYLYQGKYDLAQAQTEKIFSLDPESQLSFDIRMGQILLLKGDLEGALKQFQKIPEANQARRVMLSDLYLLQGRFDEVNEQLSKKPVFHETLVYFYIRTRKPREALTELEEILARAKEERKLFWQVRALHAKGIAYAQTESLADATQIADEIRGLIPPWMNKKLTRYYDHLMGMIEMAKGNYSRAILFLSRAEQSLYAPEDNFPRIQPYFIYTLARAYYEADNLQKAQETHEKILSLHLGRIEDGDFYARSIYWLGKIFDRRAQKERAIEHYEKFLQLWGNADPGIPEVEDARSRLTALK
jgi:tetratricopeptide (TPR) repeat protein